MWVCVRVCVVVLCGNPARRRSRCCRHQGHHVTCRQGRLRKLLLTVREKEVFPALSFPFSRAIGARAGGRGLGSGCRGPAPTPVNGGREKRGRLGGARLLPHRDRRRRRRSASQDVSATCGTHRHVMRWHFWFPSPSPVLMAWKEREEEKVCLRLLLLLLLLFLCESLDLQGRLA